MAKVLITGAHGFLGSHLCEAYLAAGHQVTALVSPWGKLDNITHLAELHIVRADIRDETALTDVCKNVEIVVHAAAKVADWGRWQDFYSANVKGTIYLLRAAQRANVARFLLVSSIAVHPYRGFVNADTRNLSRDSTINAYARSKRMAEDAVMMAKLPWTIIRPGLWVFGERDPQFARVVSAIARGQLPLVGDGQARINTAYAANLAEGICWASCHDAATNQSFLLADDGQPTWAQLFTEIAHTLGVAAPKYHLPAALVRLAAELCEGVWRFMPAREPPLTRYRARLMTQDIHLTSQATQDELGYTPALSWQAGIARACSSLELTH
ncbi:MAG: NAD-dependent epimerase/dehydratase family protein [Deinococcota bacterium]